jgi:hypothetical protein
MNAREQDEVCADEPGLPQEPAYRESVERAIWRDVLAQAVQDYTDPDWRYRSDAALWFACTVESPASFEFVCTTLGIDANWFRSKLKTLRRSTIDMNRKHNRSMWRVHVTEGPRELEEILNKLCENAYTPRHIVHVGRSLDNQALCMIIAEHNDKT